MLIRKRDENGDIYIGHSLVDFLSGDQAIAELLKRRIMLWLGEWFLNVTEGVDWANILGCRPAQVIYLERQMRSVILGTQGVESIQSYDQTFDHRTDGASVTASILTENNTTLALTISGQDIQVQMVN